MMSKPLKDVKVLDLTHRLPGPLAGHLLCEMGASVTKVEDKKFGDPFRDGFFKEMDPSFSLWYESLNADKEVLRFSLKEEKSKIHKLIENSDIVLMGLPQKLQGDLGIDFKAVSEKRPNNRPVVYIEMFGSHSHTKGMHDLNALAQKNLLDLYLDEVAHLDEKIAPKRIAPPFLPFAGIGYGAMLSNQATAAMVLALRTKKSVQETISLEESIESLLSPFYSKKLQQTGQKTFLHNGRYPCYNIYPLKDKGHLAVACLEPKYWEKFCELLGLGLSLEERFEFKTDTVFSTIQSKVKEITFKEAYSLFKDQDCCVDVIGATPA